MMLQYNPLVSVCISTYNNLEHLKLCIESIQCQDYQYIEVVIVDYSSNQDTHDYCKGLIKDASFPVLYRLLSYESSAIEVINESLHMADGEYILLLCDDSRIGDPHGISNLVKEMDVTVFALVYTNLPIHVDECIEPSNVCTMFRSDIGDAIGWFDESYDITTATLDLGIRASNSGYKLLLTNEGGVVCGSNHKLSACEYYNQYKNNLRIINRYFAFDTRILALYLTTWLYTYDFWVRCGLTRYWIPWIITTIWYVMVLCNPFKCRYVANDFVHQSILYKIFSKF